MKQALSETRKKILEYLKEAAVRDEVPSVREICNATGLRSTSTVHAHLKVLEEEGYISRSKRGHRSIRMSGKEPSVTVPVIGKVTAGLPILAFEEVSGYVPYSAAKAMGKELFALNVRGESMRDIGIYDGDVENGEVEIGQVTGLLKGREIEPVATVMDRIVQEYYAARRDLINQAMDEMPSRRTLI